MSDTYHCIDEINQEISVYWSFVYISLGLTIVSIFVRRRLRNLEASHPNFRPASRFFLGIGILKVLLGILLVSVLLPKCPIDCTCSNLQIGHFTYGYIAMGLGVWWLYQGHYFHKKANESTEYTVSGDGVQMSTPEITTTPSEDKELV